MPSPFIRKPLSVVYQQESASHHHSEHIDNRVQRHLTLTDLIGIGVGGTVGSGIFVLCGQIAAQYAGPSTFLSFAIAGAAACCSGLCYAELSARIPAEGSSYVYTYVVFGELCAVLAAACLTLEYGIAGAAVARSWGDKIAMWLNFETNSVLNLPACVVSMASTALLLAGVQESKHVTNYITLLKMGIVLFMIVFGFYLYQSENMQPLVPLGVAGIFRGATSSFFGYLGYDEVCCVAGEAIHPARDMPRAVLGTLVIVTIVYVLASAALTGMLSYSEISPTSGFPDAFASRGYIWASHVTAVGEIVTLPVVVLISLMAQPRLTLSMAHDGLLPSLFAKLDDRGNLYGGTLVSGILMTIIATFVPFTYLDDLISAGILVAFCMTNSCLVMLRCENPPHRSKHVEICLLVYNALCFVSAILWSHVLFYLPAQHALALLTSLLALAVLVHMVHQCPRSAHFGGCVLPAQPDTVVVDGVSVRYFSMPLVPYLPCAGMAVNWYLIAQLETVGILLLLLYLGLTTVVYLTSCAHSSVGHNHNWSITRYEHVGSDVGEDETVGIRRTSQTRTVDFDGDAPPPMQRAQSLM